MSESTGHSEAPSDDLLAAEYVLGVLARAERSDVERRLAREPSFALLVAAWEERLSPWAAEIAEAAPPPSVWERIVKSLPAMPQTGQADWWNALPFWRGLAAGAGALAVASLTVLFFVVSSPAPRQLIAALDGGGHHHFIATVDTQRAQVLVAPAAYADTPGRVAELWLIAPGDKPRSLGLLNSERAIVITIPANLLAVTNTQAVLAVSLEPTGGSTTGAPTGPVIASGKLTSL